MSEPGEIGIRIGIRGAGTSRAEREDPIPDP